MSDCSIVDEARIAGVILQEVCDSPGRVLAEHAHEGATVGILLAGTVVERRGNGELRVQHPGDVFVRRSGEPHANQYSTDGARALFLELERDDPRAAAVAPADGLVCEELRVAGEHVARAFRSTRG